MIQTSRANLLSSADLDTALKEWDKVGAALQQRTWEIHGRLPCSRQGKQ